MALHIGDAYYLHFESIIVLNGLCLFFFKNIIVIFLIIIK